MYRQHFSTRVTPQSEPIPTMDMIRNDAGGYVFAVDDWQRLDRFLILGSEGGSYYVNEHKLTVDNAQAVLRCIKEDGLRVVNQIVEISDSGRAVKNDPALFALAMCSAADSVEVRRAALVALPKVARIGTHLFHFAEYVEGFRGWGRALRRAVANWYNEMPLGELAYQMIKYQQRDGWSHRDLLRLAHPSADTNARDELYKYVVKGNTRQGDYSSLLVIEAFEYAKDATDKQTITSLIHNHALTREMIPTKWLNESDVWAALLPKMPMGALVRNLGKMTSVGLLQPMGDNTQLALEKLLDQEYIRKSRLHPLSVLVALKVYSQGHGMRGSLEWSPVREIVDALDECFYLAFGNVKPTGKRMMLALDVSGSMSQQIAGMPITAAEATAAMALVTARVEPQYWMTAFSDRIVDIDISPRQRMDDVLKYFGGWGNTDCALPMLEALEKNVAVDVFTIWTDNETWAGAIHPTQALTQYREKIGIPAKLVTVGMTSSGFSIADPNDSAQLDIIGFDTSTPGVISNFSIE